jgi:hypothetical protein
MDRLSAFITLTILILFLNVPGVISQTISPMIFGQNAWMPDSIGNKKYYGQLHKKWNDIKTSSATVIRFGGIAPDEDKPTNFQYIQMIDSIRSKGMEPILQVPYYNGKYSASQAAEIVRYVNVTMKRNIKYWIIGNEPDHVYKFTSSSQVAPYLRTFSFAMKDVDPSIKIIGPETAWYNSGIINGLTSAGGPDDVTGKDSKGRFIIDLISFHTYPFNGSQTRADVINYLSSPGKLRDNLATLNSRIKNCNTHHKRTGDQSLQIAITEANICYKNSSTDDLNGNGAMSFIGGQFWAEMLSVSLSQGVSIFNFWSVVEGNGVELNIGYLNKFNGNRQPTWHHFKLMADHFKGSFVDGTDNQANVKAFGSKSNSQIVVMILNQSSSTNHNYSLRLNSSPLSGSNTLQVNIHADVNKEITGSIQNQSSVLLVFDPLGNLMKRCEYKLNGHANNNLPPSCTLFPPSANVTASGPLNFCEGGSVIFSTEQISGYTYQWKRNGSNISGANAASYKATTSGKYQVDVTSAGGTSTSTVQDVLVNSVTTAAVNITSSDNSICSGTSVSFTATPLNGGSLPSYQWKRNGVNVGTNNSVYTTSSASNGDVITCVMVSGKECVVGSPATSNSITITVTQSAQVSVAIFTDQTEICQGTPITFNAVPTNGGSSPSYQWKRNGSNVGQDNAVYTTTLLINGDVISCVISSSQNCITGSPATSNAITMNVVQPSVTGIFINTADSVFCYGSSATFYANASNEGNFPVFQWKRNGLKVGGNSSTYTAQNFISTDTITCELFSDKKCTTGNPVVSNAIIIKPFKPLSKITAGGPIDFCEGESVMLYSNIGTGFSYQWLKNDQPITLAQNSLLNVNQKGTYKVGITEKGCYSQSNEIKVDVTSKPLSNISISGSSDFCNAPLIYMSVEEKLDQTYQWRVDSVNIFAANRFFHEAHESGNYQVVMSNKCGTSISDGVYLDPCIVSNIEDIDSEPFVKYYPNPSSGVLTIEYINGGSDDPIEISVYDHIGKLIYEQEPTIFSGKYMKEISFSSALSSGIYFLKIRSGAFYFSTRIILSR